MRTPAAPPEPAPLPFDAGDVYARVWRVDFTSPGFVWLDAGEVESSTLRAWMVELKERLSDVNARRTGRGLVFRTLGRFDQQVTTKFHLDGAPDQSLLMLGYEPSDVRSRLFLADYTRAAFDLGLTPPQFLAAHNPMYRAGEERLAGYVTELPELPAGHSGILLVNNSSVGYTPGGAGALGVLHKAEIVNPDDSAKRVVNSALLIPGDVDEIGPEASRAFMTTDRLSPKVYG